MSENREFRLEETRAALSSLHRLDRAVFCGRCANRHFNKLLPSFKELNEVMKLADIIRMILSSNGIAPPNTREIQEMLDGIATSIDAAGRLPEFYDDIFDIVQYAKLALCSDDDQWAVWAAQRSYDIAFELAQRAIGTGIFSDSVHSIEGHPIVQQELLAQEEDINQLHAK